MGGGGGAPKAAAAVALSEFFIMPFVYFPLYYIFNTVIQSVGAAAFETAAETAVETAAETAAAPAGPGALVRAALSLYWVNLPTDMLACWALWIPGDSVNFFLVPMHFRVPVR